MKIKLDKQQLGGMAPAQWLRRAGYALIHDYYSDQESFARRFGRDFYPRFHLYVQEIANSNQLFFNLHLDHKKASYEGQARHSADYDGELVEEEAQRLRSLLLDLDTQLNGRKGSEERSNNNDSGDEKTKDVLRSFKSAQISEIPKYKKKSFWQKIFS